MTGYHNIFTIFSVLVLLIAFVAEPSRAELSAEDYYNTGISYADAGQLELAKNSLMKAIEAKPDYAKAFNAIGTIFYEEGQNNLAVAAFQKALQIDTEYVDPHYNMGITLTKLKQYAAALFYYEAAINLDPNCGNCYNNIAITRYFLQDFENAEKDVESALQLGVKVNPLFIKALKKAKDDEKKPSKQCPPSK
jgi:Tfp pilus assembly protein PilF